MSGWFELRGGARLGRCATDDCGGQPAWRLEAGGVGSNYCSGCAAKIRDLAAPMTPDTKPEAVSDVVERLKHLISLNEPRNGGPYGGHAAEQCMTAMTEAVALLTTLQTERDALLRLVKLSTKTQAVQKEHVARVMAEGRAEAAELREDALRKALEPFVAAFEARRDFYSRRHQDVALGYGNFDKMPDDWPMEKMAFTMGDFRRVRSIIAKEQNDG